MAVRTKEEILNSIKERFSDDTSDEALTFIEDVTDTLNDYETRTNDSTDWKQKYEDNDKEWRQKYKARFFEPTSTPDNPKDDNPDASGGSEDDETKSPMTFEELFK